MADALKASTRAPCWPRVAHILLLGAPLEKGISLSSRVIFGIGVVERDFDSRQNFYLT